MTPIFDLTSLWSSPLFSAWQRAAADSMAAVARDQRLLRLGTGMLRSQLLWARAWQASMAAVCAPIEALDAGDDATAQSPSR